VYANPATVSEWTRWIRSEERGLDEEVAQALPSRMEIEGGASKQHHRVRHGPQHQTPDAAHTRCRHRACESNQKVPG